MQISPDEVRPQDSIVKIKKCRYLEASGCVGMVSLALLALALELFVVQLLLFPPVQLPVKVWLALQLLESKEKKGPQGSAAEHLSS